MAGNYESIDNVRALSQTEVNKLSAPQLKKALMAIITADKNDEPSNNDLLSKPMFRRLTKLRKKLNVCQIS